MRLCLSCSRDGGIRRQPGNSYRGRDSMGRYSRSSETDRMKEQLERMMEESYNETIREAIRQCARIIVRKGKGPQQQALLFLTFFSISFLHKFVV